MKSSRLVYPALAVISFGIALSALSSSLAFADTGSSGTSTPPVLSNVAASDVASSSATITWSTDVAASSEVLYGTTTAYDNSSTLDMDATTTHSVALSDLAAGTTYHFQVQSTDAGGTATSSDQTFVTATSTNIGTTSAATVISGISVADISTTSATVSWNTDQPASSQIFYGTTEDYNASTTLDSTATTTHSVMLSALAAGTTYHFQVQSGNDNGVATSSDQAFATASSTSNTGGGGTTGTSTPLAIDGIDTNQGTATADGSWNDGWQWTFHFTVPVDETQFALNFADFTGSGSTIPVANNVRYYSSESSNATSSDSAIVISAAGTYPTTMLNLTGDTATSTAGRQIDVIVQMAVPSGTAAGSYSATWNAESTTTASSTSS